MRNRQPRYVPSAQPEYERLNVSATPPGVDPQTQAPFSQNAPMRSFHAAPRSPQPVQRPMQASRPAPLPNRSGSLRPPLPQEEAPAHRLPVQVGNHEDTMWFDNESVGHEAGYYIDNNDYMDADALQGMDPLASQAATDSAAWVQAHNAAEQAADIQPSSFRDLPFNSYVVMYKDEVLYQGPSEGAAKKTVESVLMQPQTSSADVVVLKRIGVDFGIMFV